MATFYPNAASQRQPNPETMRAFGPGISVTSLAGIRHDCLCTWVYRNGGFHLKFPNRCCPVRAHVR